MFSFWNKKFPDSSEFLINYSYMKTFMDKGFEVIHLNHSSNSIFFKKSKNSVT